MTRVNGFYIQIELPNGTIVGQPITDGTGYEHTAPLDGIGSFRFNVPASSPRASLLQNERIARAYANINGGWLEVGAGPINRVERVKSDNGPTMLAVSGADLLRELTYPSVFNLKLAEDHSFISHADALEAIEDIYNAHASLADWTITPDSSPPNDELYARFAGENTFVAMAKVIAASNSHFRRGIGRNVIVANTFSASGIRAVSSGRLSAETCAITHLSQRVESYDLYNVIYFRGTGNGDIAINGRSATRSMPSGYTFVNTAGQQPHIINDASVTTYGRRERFVDFKEIGPIDNTDADLQAADNVLVDAALLELQWHSVGVLQAVYDADFAGCSALLQPLQSIMTVYRNDDEGFDIDQPLNILERTWRIENNLLQTVSAVIAVGDRFPNSSGSVTAEAIAEGKVYAAHPQVASSTYWENATLYVGANPSTQFDEFVFITGAEVTQVTQIVFRYRLKPVQSFTSVSGGVTAMQVAVKFEDAEITLEGTIEQEPHVHNQRILDTPTPGSGSMKQLYFDITNDLLAVGVSGTGTFDYAATTEGGGDAVVNMTAEADLDAETTLDLDLSNAITTDYGIYKAPIVDTFALDELEYSVDNIEWVTLDTGAAVGDDFYEFDITDYVQQDNNLFRPTQENHVLKIRSAAGSATSDITLIHAIDTDVVEVNTDGDHGLSTGQRITITGTADYNGSYVITDVTGSTVFEFAKVGAHTGEVSVGQVVVNRTAMVQCKIGVRVSHQNIRYGAS
jgi:hypothetical protein